MKARLDGDRLVTSQRSWLLFFLMKRIVLDPQGYTVRTWRDRGSTRMLSELRGFVMLQRCLDLTTTPIHLVWISHVVWRDAEGDLYGPLYLHGSHADGAYYCSLLNAHLETLRRGSTDPYRQLPAPA